jgi:glycosyltransferase involved in cell wall biosynthesis
MSALIGPLAIDRRTEQERAQRRDRRLRTSTDTMDAVNRHPSRADFIVCSSAKQRGCWLGHLAALARVNPFTYAEYESLTSLVAAAPFGLPDAPLRRTGPGVKGVIPGIGSEDQVVLWAGGDYIWFDLLTLIRSVDRVRSDVPEIRLVILGMRNPNPGVPSMEMAEQANALSDSLGLTCRRARFNEQRVDFADLLNFQLDADAGVSCHYDRVETEFSFRTRILDLRSGLPFVCTDGDAFGDLVSEGELGIAVPPWDAYALAAALRRMPTDDVSASSCAERSAAVAQEFTWAAALRPLVEYWRSPKRAADQVERVGEANLVGHASYRAPRRTDLRADWELARTDLREGGLREAARGARGRLRPGGV